MSKKILVTYATRQGSTAEVAEKISQTLTENGFQVDVCSMGKVTDLSQYDGVVAGSPIQGQKWLPEAMQFLEAHKLELASKPFATFTLCITLGMKNAENYRQGVAEWMSPVRNIVRPISEGLFAGRLIPGKLPLTSNGIGLRMAVLFGVLPKGDHIDWEAIQSWATDIANKLQQG